MEQMKQQQLPSIVPGTAKQDGEAAVSQRWSWVEAAAWTPRMLHALEQGVKGGVWKNHQRWPNVFFREHGLFSMAGEHARLVQSS